MKKIVLSVLLVVALFMPTTQINALQKDETPRITSQKTPVEKEQVKEVKSLSTGYGQDPIVYGNYLYTIETGWGSTLPKLLQINKVDMTIVKSVNLIGQTGYTPFIAGGDGQIFVPLSDGRIQAFDATTLVSTWISKSPQKVENIASRLTYYDGYLYYGTGGSSASIGDLFICVSTKDEDITQTMETKELTWTYDSGQGYYWSEAVIINDSIAFAGYDGKIVLHDLKNDTVYDSVDLTIGAITNSLFYDQESKKIIAANKNGYVATITVNNHDLMESTVKRSEKFSGQFSSSPLCYNGRIYIGGGSNMGAAASTFAVINLDTLQTIYTIDQIKGQCIPILSTAYASDDNHQEVQLYMINFTTDSNKQTNLYHITDNEINTTPNYQSLYALPSSISTNWWNGSLIMDESAFYAYNGNGVLVRFGFDTTIQTEKDEQKTVSDLNKEIAALPTKDNVSVSIEAQLEKIISTYSRLGETYKKEVKNINQVEQLQDIIKEQNTMIKQLNEDITNKLNIYYISKDDESLVNTLIADFQRIHLDNRTLIQGYQDVLDAKEIIDQLKKNMISSKVFENIFGEDINYTVKSTSNTQLSYSFTFNGMDLKDTKPFNFEVSNTSDFDQLIKGISPNAFILDLKFNGSFPGKATFEIETTLKDGKYVLYYFNEEKQQVEYIQDVIVKDSKTAMILTHASTYFISEKLDLDTVNAKINTPKDKIDTSDQTVLLLPFLGMLIGCVGIYISRNKKKI